MKKMFLLLTVASLIFMCSCVDESTIGIIGGADGPTSVIVSSGK